MVETRLVGLSGEYGGSTFPITAEQTLIGRGEDCDLQIVDSRISRNHAILRLEGEVWMIEDLGSSHGTFIKGERIDKAILQHGDTITLGETILRFENPSSQDSIPTQMASADDTPTKLDLPDSIATELAEPDDVATVMATPDDVPTQLASPDDLATVMAIDQDEEEPGQAAPPTVKAVEPPVVPPPAPPTAVPEAAGLQVKKPFPWKWIAIGGGALVIIAIVGFGLTFLGGMIGDRQATSPEPPGISDEQMVLTIEAQSGEIGEPTPLIPPTLTPTPEGQVAAEALLATPQVAEPTTTETIADPGLGAQTVIGGSVQIAYASDRSGRPQIYLIDIETLEERQLTDLSAGACQPAWSGDGSKLAYTAPCNVNREEYSGSSVFVMEVDPAGNPGVVTQLITTVGGGDYDPAWSRDGSRIAFTSWRTGRPQIFTANPDGSDLRNLNDDLAFNWAPAWSGDGSQLAFLTGRGGQEEIWTVPAGGGEERRFTRSDGKDIARPDWSPDGSTIVFEKIVGNIPRLIAAPVADGGVRELQVCQEGQLSLQPMGEPTWSPDGAWLAFETWPDGVNHEIAIMRASCTEYRLLTTALSLEFDAAWRPVR